MPHRLIGYIIVDANQAYLVPSVTCYISLVQPVLFISLFTCVKHLGRKRLRDYGYKYKFN